MKKNNPGRRPGIMARWTSMQFTSSHCPGRLVRRFRKRFKSKQVVVGDNANHDVVRIHHRQPGNPVVDQELECWSRKGLGFWADGKKSD